jgi:hypothetical protein
MHYNFIFCQITLMNSYVSYRSHFKSLHYGFYISLPVGQLWPWLAGLLFLKLHQTKSHMSFQNVSKLFLWKSEKYLHCSINVLLRCMWACYKTFIFKS